ncbi:MAG: DUF5615 family PIN-like protein [Planctomycetia bacterium]|nr:DUF5615 family PIN-like protein [Candidatus Brocadia sp.]QOJ06967.1 MAG: DUF5615 family PIN-like protein [Planctomycetia bacterium]GJQ22921.1 MAG: hypothetical protein HBSAPP01_07110 [Candidatus Brocadia sapporoensis]
MSIKFLLDENIPYALIDLLESRGFTVMHLKRIGKGGIRNGEVLNLQKRIRCGLLQGMQIFRTSKNLTPIM